MTTNFSGEEDNLLFTISNNNEYYLDLMKVLLQSLSDNDPGQKIKVYLINCDNNIVEKMGKVNNNAMIVNENICLPDDPKKASSIIAHYRTTIMKECLCFDKNEKIGWVDSDIIVRKSLSHFWELTVPNSLHILYRRKNELRCKFQVGVFSLGKSKEVVKMIKEWDRITSQDNSFWFAEQQSLYVVYEQFSKNVNKIDMDLIFNDHSFNSDSVVWHCKGNHFNNKIFQKEFQHYLKKANDKYDR